MSKKQYDITGIFVNLNPATEKKLLDAINDYSAEHCIKRAAAAKSLMMKALIAEGRIERNTKVNNKARN
ncbi:MAG: hypothetical protein ACYC69_16545 [Thermodesulfovibrionales bacterium]